MSSLFGSRANSNQSTPPSSSQNKILEKSELEQHKRKFKRAVETKSNVIEDNNSNGAYFEPLVPLHQEGDLENQ